MGSAGAHLLLYDGVCGLCNRMNQFVLKRDRGDLFRFSALQGELGRGLLSRHGRDPDRLDTFYVVVDRGTPAERLLSRSDAAVFVLRSLGWPWRAAAAVLRLLPRRLRDAGYNVIARNRYRWFGQHDTCPIPDPRHRMKFLDA
jgi:predicted DCC family thiol-disulfide oxidoreductase YuxK